MTRLEETIQRHGRPLLGFSIQGYNNGAFIEMAAALGLKVLWIEMEHQQITLPQAADLCRLASGLGLLVMIRIPDARRENVLRAAECGPDIIDLPMANSPEIVAELVTHAKYPPVGKRGYFSSSRALRYGMSGDIPAEQTRINRELCLMGQIETREAAERVDEICAVPGLDALFIGPGDLSSSLGIVDQRRNPLLLETMDRIIAAATRHGKLVALPGNPADAGLWAEKGVDLFFIGSDISCLGLGATTFAEQARKALGA